MRRPRWPIGILFSAGLVILLGVLAWLQYTWLGEVSEADRARRQTLLRQRANEFADEFDREITRAYVSFQIDTATLDRDPSAFAGRYESWRQNARAPQIVRGVYVVDAGHPEQLQEYRADERRFVSASWSADLQPVRERVAALGAAGHSPLEAWSAMRDPIIASVPALVIAMPQVQTFEAGSVRSMTNLHFSLRAVVVVLDGDYLRSTFLPALADRYFPPNDIDAYLFAIVDARHPESTVFSRGLAPGAALNAAQADATASVFTFRPDLVDRMAGGPRTAVFGAGGSVSIMTAGRPAATVTPLPRNQGERGRLSVFFEQRTSTIADGRGDRLTNVVGADVRVFPASAWQLVLRHPAGSLQAAVTETRRRNLGLSFGILALLGVSALLIVVNARRAQRLATQQMEFVATVTHELRTPLTVIRSAAQNLSAGVVDDAAQTRRYGDLIDTEGRRLSEMVEQVLDYAGLNDRRLRNGSSSDVGELVRDVAASFETLGAADRVHLEVQIDDGLPPVLGDARALRRAVENLLTNALKYGGAGGWIGVQVRRAAGRSQHGDIQISVSDRGRGIDPADLPHIFEPFYRGAHAVKDQIQGNGLGLSLVKRIADVHGGQVTVKTAPGEGATFTISLRGSEAGAAEAASAAAEVGRVEARPTSGT
jgi:signal transduction histidine kinase